MAKRYKLTPAYYRYMLSPEWKAKRDAIKRRSGGLCEKCHKRKSVHVHHKTYTRLFHEHLDDLIDLCLICHQKKHPNRTIGNFKKTKKIRKKPQGLWTIIERKLKRIFGL